MVASVKTVPHVLLVDGSVRRVGAEVSAQKENTSLWKASAKVGLIKHSRGPQIKEVQFHHDVNPRLGYVIYS